MPSGAKRFDVPSITDLAPEFTITAPDTITVSLDGTQAPILVGETATTATFRYWINGDTDGQSLTLNFIADTWAAIASDGAEISNTASTAPAPTTSSRTYIDVRFLTLPGVELDTATITGTEFTLSGNGAGTTEPEASQKPTPLGNGTYRYYLRGPLEWAWFG